MGGPRLFGRIYSIVLLTTCGAAAALLVCAWVLTGFRPRLALAAGVVAGAAALAGFWAVRRLVAPIEAAGAAAPRIAAGEPLSRLPTGTAAEVDALTEAVTQLARRLQQGQGDAARQRSHQDAVLASMTEGVLAVDSGGRIITLNPAAAALFHMGGVPYLGRTLAEVVRSPEVLKFVERIDAGGPPGEIEVALAAGGTRRHLRVIGTRLADRDGRRIGTLVVLSDVTRLRQLENLRREFVANVSHELKTPVTAIKGAADTLLDGAADDPGARDRFLAIIRRQSERLTALISDTLSLARIEQSVDRGAVNLAAEELAPVLEAAAAACEPQAVARGVTLDVACEPGLFARMDRLMVEQAVINLLQNAVTYSPEGGRVVLSARPAADGLEIAVADRGPGIEPEHLPRIFERFYRVDPARSRDQGGTGLGLAIVKHTALAHGGRVSVDSEPGKGSTFRIHLPRA